VHVDKEEALIVGTNANLEWPHQIAGANLPVIRKLSVVHAIIQMVISPSVMLRCSQDPISYASISIIINVQ
jgi:hypothetical protein